MRVLVYVEGPSDQAALRALLRSVLADSQRRGVGVQFLPLGDKAKILNTSAEKAARHLAEHPDDWVFALPDLYPMAPYDGTLNEHRSFADLERLLGARFDAKARQQRITAEAQTHFRVHCLKHDLEVLLLASIGPSRATSRRSTRRGSSSEHPSRPSSPDARSASLRS